MAVFDWTIPHFAINAVLQNPYAQEKYWTTYELSLFQDGELDDASVDTHGHYRCRIFLENRVE
jgi:hypothetical protein